MHRLNISVAECREFGKRLTLDWECTHNSSVALESLERQVQVQPCGQRKESVSNLHLHGKNVVDRIDLD